MNEYLTNINCPTNTKMMTLSSSFCIDPQLARGGLGLYRGDEGSLETGLGWPKGPYISTVHEPHGTLGSNDRMTSLWTPGPVSGPHSGVHSWMQLVEAAFLTNFKQHFVN